MKICPKCKAVQLSSASICSKCGADLNGPATDTDPGKAPTPLEGQGTSYGSEAVNSVSIYEGGEVPESSGIYETEAASVEEESSGIYELTEEEQESRNELINEMEDLRTDGYVVTRLENSLNGDLSDLWGTFNQFMDDIDALVLLKEEFESLECNGFDKEAEHIRSRLMDPDAVEELAAEIGFLKTRISEKGIAENIAAACDEDEKIPPGKEEEEVVVPRRVMVSQVSPDTTDAGKSSNGIFGILMKLTNARSSFGSKEYPKAKGLYSSVLEADPDNEEARYYLEKIDRIERGEELSSPHEGPMVHSARATMDEVPVYEEPLPVESEAYRSGGNEPAPDDLCDAEMNETDRQRTLAKYDALAFKAYINRDWALAIEHYDRLLALDPEFKNATKRKLECQKKLEEASLETTPRAKKKKKKKKIKKKAPGV